jgi:putative addiction module component (TIGR02574 family)
MTKQQIIKAAKGLELDDRMDIVDELIATVTPDERREIDAAWNEEIERRIDDMESGWTKPIPAEKVFKELERKYKR